MNTETIWKPIEELDGLYHISNYGHVKSFKHDKQNGRLISYKRVNGRYWLYVIRHKGEVYNFYAHRLCGQYFIPNPLNLPQIDHICNLDKENNHVSNLQWITHLNNIRKDQAHQIICLHKDGREIIVEGSREAQKLTGVCRPMIFKLLKTGTESKKGWQFKYNK